MVTPILSGILLGLIISFMIGPVFFGLIKTSIHQGLRQALVFEIGTVSSDIVIIYLSYAGLAAILMTDKYAFTIGIVGSILLLIFGIYPFVVKKPLPKEDATDPELLTTNKSNPFTLISKAFLLNTVNPSVFLFWIFQASLAVSKYNGDKGDIFTHFSTAIITMFAIDVLKAYLAVKIKRFLKPTTFALIGKIEGVLLILFAFVVFYSTYFKK